MVLSMGLVLAVVAVALVLAWRPLPDPVRVVDPRPVIAVAATQADFAVLQPTGLAPQWRATSARWEPTPKSGAVAVLHLGYVTPSDQYAQVTQARIDYAPYLAEQTADGVALGPVQIGERTWVRMDSGSDRTLVLTEAGVTTVVRGSAPWPELTQLAAALRPVG